MSLTVEDLQAIEKLLDNKLDYRFIHQEEKFNQLKNYVMDKMDFIYGKLKALQEDRFTKLEVGSKF